MDLKQIIVRVPQEYKQDLQILAIKNNTSMTKIINNLIEDYILKNK